MLKGRTERGSLSTDVRPFLNHLYKQLFRLFFPCTEGFLYHFNSFRTTFFKFQAKLYANLLFTVLRHKNIFVLKFFLQFFFFKIFFPKFFFNIFFLEGFTLNAPPLTETKQILYVSVKKNMICSKRSKFDFRLL